MKKKKSITKIIISLAVLLLIAVGILYMLNKKPVATAEAYSTYTASVGSITNAISLSGTFEAQHSETYTASSDATVRTIYVSAGDTIKEGDKLLRLSTGETVKADFDGRVNTVSVALNDTVTAGDTLLQIADFTNLEVSVQVDEYDIANVYVGQPCMITATANNAMAMAAINSISYISSTSTGSVAYYTAVINVEAPNGVYPGMQASVVITQEEAKDVVVLKQSALNFDINNQAYVLMDDADNPEAKKQVTVEVGITNGYYVEIKSGLSDGDVVYAKDDGDTTTSAGGMNMGMMFGAGMGGERPEGMQRERPDGANFGGGAPSAPGGN